jgi:restriction system protein
LRVAAAAASGLIAVTSFVADFVGEQRKAREATRRLQLQAEAAWAREEAKSATANARERAKQDSQAAREREVAAEHAEAEAVTRALQARLTELETLLLSTLGEDPYVPFDQLKEPLILTEFRPPEQLAVTAAAPQESDFMPKPPSGLGALAPGRKRAYAATVAQGRADYEQAITAHAHAEQRRREQLGLVEVFGLDAEKLVDRFAQGGVRG